MSGVVRKGEKREMKIKPNDLMNILIHEGGGFDNNWKSNTKEWIQKKGYGIKVHAPMHQARIQLTRPALYKELNTGTMVSSSGEYGKFDLNAIERPKHARVSVTKEFNDISHLG